MVEERIVKDTGISGDLMSQNPEVIAELLALAEQAPEPGDLKDNPVINEGTDKAPLPMVVTVLKSADWMYLWDTKTGERSLTNRNMLPTQLSKLRPDKTRYFTTIDPGIPVRRGTHRCMLHPENANRKHYDLLGFAVCEKSNLTNDYQVRRHMSKRHKDEWQAIQEEITDARRDEDRLAQRTMMETIANLAKGQTKEESEEKPPLYVSDKPPKPKKEKVKK